MNIRLKLDPGAGGGGSPTPTTPSNTGGASTSSSGGSTESPAQAATPQKIDYGMGPQSSSSNQASHGSDDDAFFKEHGERIFKHERFKELTGYKAKHDEMLPLKTFIDQAGGMDGVQQFYNYLGPVWKHLDSLGEKAPQAWNELLPVLQNFLAGKPLLAQQAAMPEPVEDDDPFAARIKPLEDRVKTFEEQQKQQAQREEHQKREHTKKTTLSAYVKLFDEKIKGLEKELIPIAFEAAVAHIPKFMPKNAAGQLLDARFTHSPEAFLAVWEKIVEPRLKAVRSGILAHNKKLMVDGGPVLPDTSKGAAPRGNATPTTIEEKAARLAQGLLRM